MAGGQGIRFWPLSVKKKPKQFLPLRSEKPLIQETYERYREWLSIEKIYVVTTEEYHNLVMEQLPELPQEQILLEPARRDTAPCVALTALYCLEKGEDEVVVMSPADHYISDPQELMNSLLASEKIAEQGISIVTLGIRPTRPETAYGYMVVANDKREKNSALKVETFIEKPSLEHAKQLLNHENIFWNTGIFIWKPSTISYYMENLQSDLWMTLKNNKNELKKAYSTLPKISIDYAVLEKASDIYMIPAKFEWDDLGTWGALERLNKEDQNENILIGNVNVSSSNNCLIIARDYDVMTVGIQDLIIVLTENGLLVCHKSQEQEIKNILTSWSD